MTDPEIMPEDDFTVPPIVGWKSAAPSTEQPRNEQPPSTWIGLGVGILVVIGAIGVIVFRCRKKGGENAGRKGDRKLEDAGRT